MAQSIIKIPPYEYIHILDGNLNVTRTEIGPQTFVLKDHETVISGKKTKEMIKLGPTQYCEIKNPVIRDKDGKLVMEKKGKDAFMVKVQNGDSEYRTGTQYPEPFPLHPEEILVGIFEIETIP